MPHRPPNATRLTSPTSPEQQSQHILTHPSSSAKPVASYCRQAGDPCQVSSSLALPRLECRTKFAPCTDLLPVCNEPKGDQSQARTHPGQNRTRPRNPEISDHVLNGQREQRASHTARHAHCRQRRGRVDAVRVGDILHEKCQRRLTVKRKERCLHTLMMAV